MSDVTVGDVAGQQDQTTVAASQEPLQERMTPLGEHDLLRAEVRRLTAENERYRVHAERTSKLFLAVTNYAEWVRESARRDAELALRKARARVEQLETTARELEEKERERARLQSELAGLQVMIDETRARLSAFLAAGLEALSTEGPAGRGDAREPALGDLRDALHSQVASTSAPAPRLSSEDEPLAVAPERPQQ